MYAIGADIGGSHISTCLFEHSNKRLLVDTMVSTKLNRKGTREEILSSWAESIKQTRKQSSSAIKGVGLAMPGPFDYYNGISLIQGVDKFESLYQVNVREELAARVEIPGEEIRFINDASAFTIAESFIGEASKYDKCVGITLGTGFGSAFLHNGVPILNRDDVPVGGFLYDKFHGALMADELFSTRGIIRAYYNRSQVQCNSASEVALKAEYDLEARETFAEFGEQLALFLAPYLQTFDAKIIALGGNICRAFHLFGKPLQEKLNGCKVYVSSHGEKAAIIGAARLLDDEYYKLIEPALKEM